MTSSDEVMSTEAMRTSPRFKAAFREALKQFLRAVDSFDLTITIHMVAGDLVFMPLLVQAYAEDR